MKFTHQVDLHMPGSRVDIKISPAGQGWETFAHTSAPGWGQNHHLLGVSANQYNAVMRGLVWCRRLWETRGVEAIVNALERAIEAELSFAWE